MLTNIQNLIHQTDGRYASDQELLFFQSYVETASLRFRTYQKIQAAERPHIMNQLLKGAEKPITREVYGERSGYLTDKDGNEITVRVLRYVPPQPYLWMNPDYVKGENC